MPAELGLKAIAFDLDDTLVASTRAIYLWQDELVRHHDLGPAGRRFLRAQHESPDPPAVTFTKIVARFGLPETPESLRAAFMERWPDLVEPVEAALEVLAGLRARGWRLGLITNGPRVLQSAKMGADMLALFDAVCFAGAEVPAKPDPEPFRQLARDLGVDPAECWMVGDSLSSDIEGAHGVGMRPLWLASDPGSRPGTRVETVATLTEILDVVGGPSAPRSELPALAHADC